jgi:hypothetical protein
MATIEQGTVGGVSFGLTDEQKALRDLAHDFAEHEIRPREREYDEGSIHPADVIAKSHELGLMNVHIPEAYGGLELGAFEGMLIGEELLTRIPNPTDEQIRWAISGNICRCTGYMNIVKAIQHAAKLTAHAAKAPVAEGAMAGGAE